MSAAGSPTTSATQTPTATSSPEGGGVSGPSSQRGSSERDLAPPGAPAAAPAAGPRLRRTPHAAAAAALSRSGPTGHASGAAAAHPMPGPSSRAAEIDAAKRSTRRFLSILLQTPSALMDLVSDWAKVVSSLASTNTWLRTLRAQARDLWTALGQKGMLFWVLALVAFLSACFFFTLLRVWSQWHEADFPGSCHVNRGRVNDARVDGIRTECFTVRSPQDGNHLLIKMLNILLFPAPVFRVAALGIYKRYHGIGFYDTITTDEEFQKRISEGPSFPNNPSSTVIWDARGKGQKICKLFEPCNLLESYFVEDLGTSHVEVYYSLDPTADDDAHSLRWKGEQQDVEPWEQTPTVLVRNGGQMMLLDGMIPDFIDPLHLEMLGAWQPISFWKREMARDPVSLRRTAEAAGYRVVAGLPCWRLQELQPSSSGSATNRPVLGEDRCVGVRALVAVVTGSAKRLLEHHLRSQGHLRAMVPQAVVAMPAGWGKIPRLHNALMEGVLMSGFGFVATVEEALVAAQQCASSYKGALVLVLDCGASTCDAQVVKVDNSGFPDFVASKSIDWAGREIDRIVLDTLTPEDRHKLEKAAVKRCEAKLKTARENPNSLLARFGSSIDEKSMTRQQVEKILLDGAEVVKKFLSANFDATGVADASNVASFELDSTVTVKATDFAPKLQKAAEMQLKVLKVGLESELEQDGGGVTLAAIDKVLMVGRTSQLIPLQKVWLKLLGKTEAISKNGQLCPNTKASELSHVVAHGGLTYARSNTMLEKRLNYRRTANDQGDGSGNIKMRPDSAWEVGVRRMDLDPARQWHPFISIGDAPGTCRTEFHPYPTVDFKQWSTDEIDLRKTASVTASSWWFWPMDWCRRGQYVQMCYNFQGEYVHSVRSRCLAWGMHLASAYEAVFGVPKNGPIASLWWSGFTKLEADVETAHSRPGYTRQAVEDLHAATKQFEADHKLVKHSLELLPTWMHIVRMTNELHSKRNQWSLPELKQKIENVLAHVEKCLGDVQEDCFTIEALGALQKKIQRLFGTLNLPPPQ